MLNLRLKIGYLFIAAVVTSSCSTIIEPADPRVIAERLPFLHQGQTTRQEVIDHLGDPVNEYEHGAIVTYILMEGRDGRFEVDRGLKRAEPPIYNLVLSFGPDEVLTRNPARGVTKLLLNFRLTLTDLKTGAGRLED